MDSGFALSGTGTNLPENSAIVSMNSTFKYWYIGASGATGEQPALTATGLDAVNFVGGTGINILGTSGSGLSNKFPYQTLTFNIDNSVIK
jgi:hypothetical protein